MLEHAVDRTADDPDRTDETPSPRGVRIWAAAMGHPAPRLHIDRAFAVSMRTIRASLGLTQQQLTQSTGLQVGVVPKIERHYRRTNAGEPTSARHRATHARRRCSEQLLRQIVAMRNFAAHQYDDLEAGRVWRTATRDVPRLRAYLVDTVLPGVS